MTRIGVIADTHGLLRPEALAFLSGSDHIVHAGDIGRREILAALASLAPLTAVRGNIDAGPWAETLPLIARLRIVRVEVLIVHELAHFIRAGRAPTVRVVVSGHSHRPCVREEAGILYVNPGSAGPRRFKLPIAVGEVIVDGSAVSARTVELAIGR